MRNKFVICHDINGHRKRVDTKKLSWRPSVYGIIIEKNKVLLSRQWDGYDFPGGGVHLSETLEQALQREFWEETGLRAKPQQIIAAATSFFILPFAKKAVNAIIIYYFCNKIGGHLTTKYLVGHEKGYASLAEWVPLTKINKIKFYNSADSVKLIRQAVKINRLSK